MLSYSQAAEILSKEIGRKISYIDITGDDARNWMKQNGMSVGWSMLSWIVWTILLEVNTGHKLAMWLNRLQDENQYLLTNLSEIIIVTSDKKRSEKTCIETGWLNSNQFELENISINFVNVTWYTRDYTRDGH